jgi:hypothetical protein
VDFFEVPPERFNGKIPFIITDVVREILARHGDETEGIFRLNGHDAEMVSLISRLSYGRLSCWPEKVTVHSLAGILKRYLRKMGENESLIPAAFYTRFLSAVDPKDPNQTVALLKGVLRPLSPVRRKILLYLCQFWDGIVQKAAKNKMTYSNLAICVGQAVMVIPKGLDALEMQKQIGKGAQALGLMIQFHANVFEGEKVSEEDFCTEDDIAELGGLRVRTEDVGNLMKRDGLRRTSLIPWVPACKVERKSCYERPKTHEQVGQWGTRVENADVAEEEVSVRMDISPLKRGAAVRIARVPLPTDSSEPVPFLPGRRGTQLDDGSKAPGTRGLGVSKSAGSIRPREFRYRTFTSGRAGPIDLDGLIASAGEGEGEANGE